MHSVANAAASRVAKKPSPGPCRGSRPQSNSCPIKQLIVFLVQKKIYDEAIEHKGADMASRYVICARDWKKTGEPGTEPGATTYLEIPGKGDIHKKYALNRKDWLAKLSAAAETGKDEQGYTVGNVLIFIHGYNNNPPEVLKRHDLLQNGLWKYGYEGEVVSFDWPSGDWMLNYLEDRVDAKTTAMQLVSDGILPLAYSQKYQDETKCDISVHLLGHSTGAYVIREAFDDADDRSISSINWTVNQLALIGADVSARSMQAGNPESESLYRHAHRITNYSSPYDNALQVSNIKRAGVAPRAGRVGLPDDAPASAVNIDCGLHWKKNWDGKTNKQTGVPGNLSHSWHFGDATFMQDLALTLIGQIDRHSFPTRIAGERGLVLSTSKA